MTNPETKPLMEVGITRQPIDELGLMKQAGHPACGAVLSFSGTVRNHHQGRQVRKLAYEAYEDMAKTQLDAVVQRVRDQWPDIKKVQAVHRFGEMDVGESSVFLTVASPHRVEGFEALRFLIDTIKHDVPIWKKEFYLDGESAWLHPEEGCCHKTDHIE